MRSQNPDIDGKMSLSAGAQHHQIRHVTVLRPANVKPAIIGQHEIEMATAEAVEVRRTCWQCMCVLLCTAMTVGETAAHARYFSAELYKRYGYGLAATRQVSHPPTPYVPAASLYSSTFAIRA